MWTEAVLWLKPLSRYAAAAIKIHANLNHRTGRSPDRSASKRTGSALSGERKGSRMRLKPSAIWGMSVNGILTRYLNGKNPDDGNRYPRVELSEVREEKTGLWTRCDHRTAGN